MASVKLVTVPLPDDFVKEIDRREKDRNKFVVEAVCHELDRCRCVEMQRSLQSPHPESTDLAEVGLGEGAWNLPVKDTEALLGNSAGKPVRWIPGEGWVEGRG